MLTHSDCSKRIARFSKHAILSAQHNAVVAPDAVSELEYFCSKDSAFRVLSDEATVVGVQLSDDKVAAKEHIVDKSCPVVTYTAGTSTVFTLVVDQHANALLAGEETSNQYGRVVQYRLDTGDVAHDYDSLGIGAVLSSARLGNLCFFGGYPCGFAVINTLTHQVVHQPVKTAVGAIDSLTVWTASPGTPDAKAVLAVAGRLIDYSADCTDMFDVTQLVLQQGSHEVLTAFVVSMRKSKQDLTRKVRTLEQQLQRQAEAHAAAMQAKDQELRQLQQQASAQAEKMDAKGTKLRRLKSDNRALRDSVRRLEKKYASVKSKSQYKSKSKSQYKSKYKLTKNKLRNCVTRNDRLTRQKLVLGLLHHSPNRLHADADTIRVLAPAADLDTDDVEDLRARLAAVQRHSQALAVRNQELHVQNLDLQAKVQTLSAPCAQW